MPYKNPEDRKQYQREYREKNKERLKEKNTCECGACFQMRYKSTHLKTDDHYFKMEYIRKRNKARERYLRQVAEEN